ncbi:hypothetical protein ACIREE_31115 [Streptomyces sp. NPDC102467]|uniref:hypothetical protein n=1 Tax=Streptomyces sp. NPDC102467 TaxID=3366179 RepID=UPI0037F530E7
MSVHKYGTAVAGAPWTVEVIEVIEVTEVIELIGVVAMQVSWCEMDTGDLR